MSKMSKEGGKVMRRQTYDSLFGSNGALAAEPLPLWDVWYSVAICLRRQLPDTRYRIWYKTHPGEQQDYTHRRRR
jgi:hypothetical protein